MTSPSVLDTELSDAPPTPVLPAPPAVVPPAGPQWFGAVMGTGILSTLTQTLHEDLPGGTQLAVVLLVIGWLLLLGLGGAFVVRVLRRPEVLAESVRDVSVLVTWGMVAMGVLSVGAATGAVVPHHWPAHAHAAWVASGALWVIGTVLGVVTATDFALRLIGRDVGAPATTWGLPVVPPMVSATTGATLVPHVGSRAVEVWLLTALVACFFLALVLGLVVFAAAYNHHWRAERLPIAASTSAWIPLGVVGQSTAAAQSIATCAEGFLLPQDIGTMHRVADVYGLSSLAVGVPLVAWAIVMTVRGFAARMPFSPGWWALTFPIGTLCLGSHLLAAGSGLSFFDGVAIVGVATLMGTWCLCAVASARAVLVRQMTTPV